MAKQREVIRQLETELDALVEQEGIEYVIDRGRRHLKVTVSRGGESRSCFVAKTPSDHRSTKNSIHDLRRAVRCLPE